MTEHTENKDPDEQGPISGEPQVPPELTPFLGDIDFDGDIPVVNAPSAAPAYRGMKPRNDDDDEGGLASIADKMAQALKESRQEKDLVNALKGIQGLTVKPESLRAEKAVWEQIEIGALEVSNLAKAVEWILAPPGFEAVQGPHNRLAEFFQLLGESAQREFQTVSDNLEQSASDYEEQDECSSKEISSLAGSWEINTN